MAGRQGTKEAAAENKGSECEKESQESARGGNQMKRRDLKDR
jgi:hypothetical protein